MNEILESLLTQLNGRTSVNLQRSTENRWPVFYHALYHLYHGEMQGIPCLLAENRHRMRLTPGMIEKHMQRLTSLTGKPFIYMDSRIGAQDAQRLFARGVPFIGGNGNIYLPFIGLRLSGKLETTFPCLTLGIPAQLLVLAVLNHGLSPLLTYQTACSFLPYSQASIHTAFGQLQSVGLCQKLSGPGRSVKLEWTDEGHKLWERAVPFFQNPCRRIVEVEGLPDRDSLPLAGESALAGLTMLASPSIVSYAINLKGWRGNNQRHLSWNENESPCLLQLWEYQPCLIGGDRIDPLSLWLSLRDTRDERVQQALEQLLHQFPW